MFFIYSLTVLYYKICSVYSECFSIKLYSILFYQDIPINLSLQKMFLSMCLEIKSFRKSFPGYNTVPDSKINNSMEMTLIFQAKYKSTKYNK